MKKIGDDNYIVPSQIPPEPIRDDSGWPWGSLLFSAIYLVLIFHIHNQQMSEKPIHVKPNLYTYMMDDLKVIARDHGYNLLVHGSMNRDLDLIAVPWVDDPKTEIELIQALDFCLTGTKKFSSSGNTAEAYSFSILPGGRHSYVIQMARHGEWNNYEKDLQYYLDISITPFVKK